METILIQPDNQAELQLIKAFLEQHKLRSRILTEEDKEDFVLGRMMEEGNHNDTLDTEEFLRKLRS